MGEFDDTAKEEINGEYCVYKNTFLEASEFSKDEIISNVNKYGRKFMVTIEKDRYVFDDLNLLSGWQGANLSYETLFEVVKRCGFNVEGNKSDFSFVGSEGATYSVARSYVEKKEKTSDIYYYLRNGERVNLTLIYGYNDFFMAEEILEMTGMTLTEIE